MSADRLRGLIAGAVIMAAFIVASIMAYGMGRASIVEQCLEYRAFTYAGGAWGCVRLRKGVRDVESDTIVKPKPNDGELM